MRGSTFFSRHFGSSMQEFLALPRDRAATLLRDKMPDLLWLLRCGAPGGEADEPPRTRSLAADLEAALLDGAERRGAALQNLRDRIVTDGFLRSELDRDQNVYLGPFYTRILTRATPDVVFQPTTHQELERALAWARRHHLGITTRGAGSTAMGGAVPNNGGLLLEMSRFDAIQIDRRDLVAVIGAGARFKTIHAQLAAEGLALKTYPSNLGGTLAGWFCAGGLGLNSFKHGPVQSQVRALSMVLPRGEHVRFHDDGRLDVHEPEVRRLTPEQGRAWMQERGYPPLQLADLAQSEGQFGVILTLCVAVQPAPRFTPFFFEFERDADAFAFVHGIQEIVAARHCPPANLKHLTAAHVGAVRRVRGDAAGRQEKPAVYVDFDDPDAAKRFETGLEPSKWKARRDDVEARRWFADRFRPQQTKRLGPGFLAAEVLLPGRHVEEYLRRATALAARVGVHLETETYFFGDGTALALPGFSTRGPRRGFVFELLLAPILLDLAMARFAGRPYVLGRWQAPLFGRKHPRAVRRRLRHAKRHLDRDGVLNPGVFFAPVFRLPFAHGLYRSGFPAGVRVLRGLYGWGPTAALFRRAMKAAVETAAGSAAGAPAELAHAARGCVNCGECNSVCPVFHDARIRLPQMLTHLGEAAAVEAPLAGTPQLLLDLCMRCGNCQEVCQADIPHLDLFARLERRAGTPDRERRERHVALLAHLRHSERYLGGFLGVRPGGYLQRTAASLPGEVRFVLFRAENDAGPTDTCVHCAACVVVCPTHANLEFQVGGDLRRISTDLGKCIGCGTCVEVCPANARNGGRTLRVMEAPVREFFDLVAAFEAATAPHPAAAPRPDAEAVTAAGGAGAAAPSTTRAKGPSR
jgi:FAD/FMN-containing dehydrogenase/ferredoxin